MAKVIARVRKLPWVIDGIERLVQRNMFTPSGAVRSLLGALKTFVEQPSRPIEPDQI